MSVAENSVKDLTSISEKFEKKNESEQERKIESTSETAEPYMVYTNDRKIGSLKYCNQCGAELDENSRFCNQCGTKISEVNIGQANTAVPILADNAGEKMSLLHENAHIEAKSSVQEAESAKYCNKCGAQIDEDSVFCNQCGATVVSIMDNSIYNEAPPIFRDEENTNKLSPNYKGGKKKYCRKCGRELRDSESTYCNDCGAPVKARLTL